MALFHLMILYFPEFCANPQLSTGRIPVNNILDAENYVNKLESYALNLLNNNALDQSWRMTISL